MKTSTYLFVAAIAITAMALTSCAGLSVTTPYGDLTGAKGGLLFTPTQRTYVIPTK